MDFSHVVASGATRGLHRPFGDRIAHVHCATPSPGDIHHPSATARSTSPATSPPSTSNRLSRATPPWSWKPATSTDDERPAAAGGAVHRPLSSTEHDHPTTPATPEAPSAAVPPRSTSATTEIDNEEYTHEHHPAHRRHHRGRRRARHRPRHRSPVRRGRLGRRRARPGRRGREKLAAELTERYGVPAYGGGVDVADEDSVLAARDAVPRRACRPSGAVLNIAGIASPVPFLDTTLELWNKVFAVNSTGTYLVTKAFLPEMIEGGYGRIVNMSSVSAQQGGGVFCKTPYSAAKAAVIGFTRSLARELGPTGITVNAIAAGRGGHRHPRRRHLRELEAAIVKSIPLGRQASVDDVAALFAFLASQEAGYITGYHAEPQRRRVHRLTDTSPDRLTGRTPKREDIDNDADTTDDPGELLAAAAADPAPHPGHGGGAGPGLRRPGPGLRRRTGCRLQGPGAGCGPEDPDWVDRDRVCCPWGTTRSPCTRRSPRPAPWPSRNWRPTARTIPGCRCRG